MENYFEADFVTIRFNVINQSLMVKWTIPPTPKEFREAMEHILSAIRFYKAARIVWDMVRLGALLEEDEQWTATNWHNRAFELGYRYGAVILPPDVFTQMTVGTVVDQLDKRFTISYFDNVENAQEWITQFAKSAF